MFGRGYGTFDPQYYRFLDNEYLGRVVETGFVGAAAYLLLHPRRAGRRAPRDRQRRPAARPARARGGGRESWRMRVASALFDALSFPQAPYLLLLLAGFISIVGDAGPPCAEPAPTRARPDSRSLRAILTAFGQYVRPRTRFAAAEPLRAPMTSH